MIDYVKILFSNVDPTRLYNLPFLDFETPLNLKTGEIKSEKTVMYNHCKITIYDSGVVLFAGSIHKFYNSLQNVKAPNDKAQKLYRGFNGSQFNINNIFFVRNHLEKLFDCSTKQMLFQNIEFGINTAPGFCPQLFLKGLLYHKGKLFEFKYRNQFSQVKHQQYYLKIYNKSEQYKMGIATLRVEIKVVKMKFLEQTGIKTFADINTSTLKNAENLLLKIFDEVLNFDYTIDKKVLTSRQKQSLLNYSNPRYWLIDLKAEHRDRHKKKLKEFILKYSDNLKEKVRQEILKKCVIINHLSENTKCVIINSSSIGLNITQKHSNKSDKKCIVPGAELSGEDANAK